MTKKVKFAVGDIVKVRRWSGEMGLHGYIKHEKTGIFWVSPDMDDYNGALGKIVRLGPSDSPKAIYDRAVVLFYGDDVEEWWIPLSQIKKATPKQKRAWDLVVTVRGVVLYDARFKANDDDWS